jgi:geranylgeranyl diphosphate synthase type II
VTLAPAVDARAFLAREAARVEAALAAVAPEVLRGAPPSLAAPMAYALETRGKRIRPILCVAAYRAVAGERDASPSPSSETGDDGVYRLGCALEIVHTYSLVHDDLPCMDDDDLRRGRPTVHRVHGTAAALLAGAALVPAAVRVLDAAGASLGLPAETRGRLAVELCRAGGAEGMVGGQLLDLQGEAAAVDAAGLERIHRGKTGALLAASLRIGGIAAGAGDGALRALTAYGQELGLAFQIVDDVLDVVGDAVLRGKAGGRDQSLGKSTYPSLFGVDGARALARARVDGALAALAEGGVRSPELEALAAFVLERQH